MKSDNSEANLAKRHDVLKLLLNQEGLRLTNQRQKILDLFTTTLEGEHLSANEVHHLMTQQGETVSYSTIYRALHVMVELGVLREVELAEDRKYYELHTPFASQHHHLVCVHCGEVIEFEDNRVTKASRQETVEQGFLFRTCHFTVFGICQLCQSSSN